jgi:hypothetical protein
MNVSCLKHPYALGFDYLLLIPSLKGFPQKYGERPKSDRHKIVPRNLSRIFLELIREYNCRTIPFKGMEKLALRRIFVKADPYRAVA